MIAINSGPSKPVNTPRSRLQGAVQSGDLSQMATATVRAEGSRFGGGPYADAAADFLALSAALLDAGGRAGDDGQSAAHNKSAVYPLISSGEAARIRLSIHGLNIDEPAFLKHYGVTAVEQLTTDKITSIDKAFAIKAKTKP